MADRVLLAALLILVAAPFGCRDKESFPSIGDQLASPIDVATNAEGSHFYVLNADFDRAFNEGSILVFDRDGNRVKAVTIPRLGRSVTVAGTDMLVTFDFRDDDADKPGVLLFDISDPANPVQKQEWLINCTPVNATMRAGYPYFAVSCLGGKLFVGELKTPRESSSFQQVRDFRVTRRALYIDPVRNLLFGFYTKLGDQASPSDQIYQDVAAYEDTIDGNRIDCDPSTPEVIEPCPNEVPDVFENSRSNRGNRTQRAVYQFFVYDLATEAAKGFPRDDDVDSDQYHRELRWMYFNVGNFDGTPDSTAGLAAENKYYRANFWEAKPDPVDPDTFYLSHRGIPTDAGSPNANHIVKVNIVGNPQEEIEFAGAKRSAFTDSYLKFERVYGFRGDEHSKSHYPGDFEVIDVVGQKLLVVNHFRDLVHWIRGDVYFSVAAKILDENYWVAETVGNTDPENSYYQLAVTPDGRVMTCSFYGNALILLDVDPGADITILKRIQ